MSAARKNTGFLNFVYDFYRTSKAHEIILSYEGVINNLIIKSFTSQAEEFLSRNKETEFLQKKIYHVMVESLQNIIKHASISENEDCEKSGNCHGILFISRDQKEYQITTGNIIQKSRVSYLGERINHTNSLSKKDLDKLYMSQLKNGKLSDEGGAGLGFIDIRRKTGSELIFQFLPVSETHEFFLLTTTIPRKV